MLIFTIILFFLLAGFFSGMETGFISLDYFALEQQAQGNKTKVKLLAFLSKIEDIIGITLIGTNLSIIVVSSLFTAYWVESGKIPISKQMAHLYLAGFLVVFAEIIPKVVYRNNANSIVSFFYPLIRFFYYLFLPLLYLLSKVNLLLAKIFGIKISKKNRDFSKSDLNHFLNEVSPKEKSAEQKMIAEALEFNDIDVKKIMTPRTEIVAFEENTPITSALQTAKKRGFTRFPVYSSNIDTIVGTFILHDLLNKKAKYVRDVKREAYFIPESVSINYLLRKMKSEKKSLVVVVDAYGGTAGIVSVEDIIEELFGEIQDEYDLPETPDAQRLKNGDLIVKGFVETDTLNQKFELNLPTLEDFNTIAGLVIDKMEKIPQRGQKCQIGNWQITILDSTKRKIKRVKLHKKHTEQ